MLAKFVLVKIDLQDYNSKQLCELFLLELVLHKKKIHSSKKSCDVKHLDGWVS